MNQTNFKDIKVLAGCVIATIIAVFVVEYNMIHSQNTEFVTIQPVLEAETLTVYDNTAETPIMVD